MFIDNTQKFCCDRRYKLVLIDLDMPEMNGFTAAQKLLDYQLFTRTDSDSKFEYGRDGTIENRPTKQITNGLV